MEENKEYEELLEICKTIIEERFVPCGLKNAVEKRIFELFQEWKKRKSEAERKGKTIGGLKVIFKDLLRAVNKAEADSKRF